MKAKGFDAVAVAEEKWIAFARQLGPSTKPVTKTLVFNHIIAKVAAANRVHIYGAADMRHAAIVYADAVQLAFRRLAAAGVIRYEPRQPLRPGILTGA